MLRSVFVVKRVILTALVSGYLTVLMACAATGAGGKGALASGPLTKENWQQDARIKAVEEIVQGVNNGVSSGTIATARRVLEYCQPYGIVERVIARDAQGRVRIYEEKGGSDTSERRIKRYYAEGGQLRFVLLTDNARGGGEIVQRVYFDDTGKRLWMDRKVAGAPEDTVLSNYSDDDLMIKNPAEVFAASSPCKEITP